MQKTIYLGGGCFWCTEAVFDRVTGVVDVESGYANGHVPNPSYEQVCDGTTGHAEVLKVVFDPQIIGLTELLQIFFGTHDPTTPNRQGNDVGTQYRSAIYTTSNTQLQAVTAFVSALNVQNTFGVPVVTQVQALESYWPAEAYHQDYFARNPHQGYCAYVVGPKVHKFLQTFAQYAKRND
ncbi:MAG: peptide-methionine (S)-S-oxide reductase MsrA [Comamonas sp.]|nr:peptide-methionine (S)-S-oxide reductase MsrA [Comamonas sp.]